MNRNTRIEIGGVLMVCAAAGILSAADPEFEVVSIRLAQALTVALAQSGNVPSRMDDSGFEQSNVSLMSLISLAYRRLDDNGRVAPEGLGTLRAE